MNAYILINTFYDLGEYPWRRGNVPDYDPVVSEFEFQSPHYIHFRPFTLRNSVNLPISQLQVETVPLLYFHKDGLSITLEV